MIRTRTKKNKSISHSDIEIMVNYIDENTVNDDQFCFEFTKAIFDKMGWKLFSKAKKCVICNGPIEPEPITGWEHGCNAEPVKKGQCCKQCDDTVVIPARIEQHFKKNKASMIKSIGYRGED